MHNAQVRSAMAVKRPTIMSINIQIAAAVTKSISHLFREVRITKSDTT